MGSVHFSDTRYNIGVIGDIPALLTLWQLFKEQTNDNMLREIGIVAAALPGETVLPETHDSGKLIPTYSGYKIMLETHPEINMIIEATGRTALVHELRNYLPPAITLVEKGAANFFINLLTSDRIWVACKADLMHTQNMLKTIIDQMDQEMLFINHQGQIIDMNKAVTDRFEQPKKDLLSLSYHDIFSQGTTPEDVENKDPFKAALTTGKPTETVTSNVDNYGRVQYYRVYAHPIKDENDSVQHVVVIRRNITQRTSIEQRLQQAEKLASIGELSTYMAHEIRNPLFTISGFANSLIRMGELSEKAREKVSIILEESKRLDAILKSLMNFTRPTEAQISEVDINLLVSATLDIMKLPCKNQSVVYDADLDPSIALVKANPDLIKQCLINLIKNSLEAMRDGGKLLITTAMNAEYVILSVEDTGHGMPLDIREKIFSPFFSTRGKGHGLGLAQTRKIIDEIGGDVDLTSKEGVGTKITLYLPPLLAIAKDKDSA